MCVKSMTLQAREWRVTHHEVPAAFAPETPTAQASFLSYSPSYSTSAWCQVVAASPPSTFPDALEKGPFSLRPHQTLKVQPA